MIKRVLSLGLSIMLLLSVCQIAVSAETIADYKVYDNFDDANKFPAETLGKSYTFDAGARLLWRGADYRTVVKGTGFGNSGYSLQLNYADSTTKTGSGSPALWFEKTNNSYTNPSTLEENKTFVYSYRLKIVEDGKYLTSTDLPTGISSNGITTSFKIGTSGSYPVQFVRYINKDSGEIWCNGVETAKYKVGAWYNIVYAISRTSESVLVTEAETNESLGTVAGKVVCQGNKTPKTENLALLSSNYNGAYTENQGAKIAIDDWSLYTINNTDETGIFNPSLVSSAVADGVVTMEFNQPVIAEETDFDLKLNGNADEFASIDSVTYPDFNKVAIKVDSLADMANYTVDFSGLTSAGGETAPSGSTCSITTPAASTPATVVGRPSYNSLAANGTFNYSVYSATACTVDVILAFYDENDVLLDAEIDKNVAISAGATVDETITFDSDNTGASKIMLYVWDGNLAPMTAVCDTIISGN